MVLITAARMIRLITSRTLDNRLSKPNRVSRYNPVYASNVLPMAMLEDGQIPIPVLILTRKAPSNIQGHNLDPKTSRAKSASPEGGQVKVTFSATTVKRRPNLARMKYSVVRRMPGSQYDMRLSLCIRLFEVSLFVKFTYVHCEKGGVK